MASLMEELLDVLQEEDRQYQELIALAEQKTEALIASKIVEIQEIAEGEQAVVEVIKRCEKKCDEVIKDMGIVLGKDTESLTVSELIDLLEKQPEEQKKLREVYQSLGQTAKRMKACNDKNRMLVEQALEMVEFDLTLFRSLRTAPETANYSKDATSASQPKGIGGFDQKQ